MYTRYTKERLKQRLCTDIKAVEGYETAIACYDEYKLIHSLRFWDSDGNRRLIPLTDNELKALDMFYERPPHEFKLIRNEELELMQREAKAYQLCRDSANYWRGRPHPPHVYEACAEGLKRYYKEKEENAKND